MERRLAGLEEEYGMTPQRQEEEEGGFFGPRGFLGNIQDYYKTDSWSDWWRNLFRSQEQEREKYPIYRHWGEGNVRTMQDITQEWKKKEKSKELD